MNQLTVWLLQTGEPLHIDSGDPRPMRAMNLANALTSSGHRVVIWTSAFYHQEKRHRCHRAKRLVVSPLLEIRLIPSPGYSRNIGFGRLWDHIVLARNLNHSLNQENTVPDVAFIGYPPIETASVMGKWLVKREIPFLLDVKDLWPLVFLEAVPKSLRSLGKIILTPYFVLAKACVIRSTGVSAMSESFLQRVLAFGGRKKLVTDGFFPLTSSSESGAEDELTTAKNWWFDRGLQDDGKIRVCYVGNLSSNVDLAPIKVAATYFMKQKLPVEFIICGDGDSLVAFKEMMLGLTNVHFPGRIGRPHVLALAHHCQASLIPYVNSENFQLSLPNKTLDALSLGLPILSPLQGEVANLISSHNVGMSYGKDFEKSLVQCIEMLLENASLRQQMSKNAIELHQERFSFKTVYGGLVRHLEMLAQDRR